MKHLSVFIFLLLGLSACYRQEITPTQTVLEVGSPVGVILSSSAEEYGIQTEGAGYSTVTLQGQQVTFYENWETDQPIEPILDEMVLRGARYVFLPPDVAAPVNSYTDVFFKAFTGQEELDSFLQTLPEPSSPPAAQNADNFSMPLIFCLTMGILGLLFLLVVKANAAKAKGKRKSGQISHDSMVWLETLAARKTASQYKTDYDVKGKRKPILQHMFTYVHGNDRFDEAVAVECPNPNYLLGEFLGEVGLSIAHTYSPRQPWEAAAFELWLFDVKNPMQTFSHIFMSEYVANTPELRAKIESEAVTLAALDANSLIEGEKFSVEARVLDMAYRQQPDLPDNCVFQHFTLEITAWQKAVEDYF